MWVDLMGGWGVGPSFLEVLLMTLPWGSALFPVNSGVALQAQARVAVNSIKFSINLFSVQISAVREWECKLQHPQWKERLTQN
jgi:hypothetical protein